MKKITIKDVDEVLYYHKLDNGLELFMIPKKPLIISMLLLILNMVQFIMNLFLLKRRKWLKYLMV